MTNMNVKEGDRMITDTGDKATVRTVNPDGTFYVDYEAGSRVPSGAYGWLADGTKMRPEYWELNGYTAKTIRPLGTLRPGDRMKCSFIDGNEIHGTVAAGHESTVVVVATDAGMCYILDPVTFTDRDGDRWVLQDHKPVQTVEWINVYADGTCGSTLHKSFETAVDASKYGKVRIGIIERVMEGGVIVSAKVHSTTPKMRGRSTPAYNPYA